MTTPYQEALIAPLDGFLVQPQLHTHHCSCTQRPHPQNNTSHGTQVCGAASIEFLHSSPTTYEKKRTGKQDKEFRTLFLLGKRSEPHTNVSHRDFGIYTYIYICTSTVFPWLECALYYIAPSKKTTWSMCHVWRRNARARFWCWR